LGVAANLLKVAIVRVENQAMPRVSMVGISFGVEEEEAVLAVLRSGHIAQGPVVERLEASFRDAVGVDHAVAVSSGTAALRLAMEVAGVGDGDLVIAPALTFAATINAVFETGASVLLADVDRHGNLDIGQSDKWPLDDISAVVPVHLYGRPVEMGPIMDLADTHGLVVVEDAAQAIGASLDGRSVGTFGIGAFSLYATKNVTTGEGGIVTTDDDRLAANLRLLRSQGSATRYEYEAIGYNYRLTDLQAAIGIPQMARLETITGSRIANALALNEGLADLDGLITPDIDAATVHAFHQYTVRVTPDARVTRSDLIRRLDEDGVDSTIVYPLPLHRYPIYRDDPRVASLATPVSDELASQVLSLPVHPNLVDEDLDRIVSSLRRQLG